MSRPMKFVPDGHRACVACATSKSKCTPLEDDDDDGRCERCHRLNKECVTRPKAHRKPRHADTSTSRPSRTAQLEERIDEIVALLAKQGSPSAHDAPLHLGSGLPSDVPPLPSQGPAGRHNAAHSLPGSKIDDAEAERLLAIFRDELAYQCPFVQLSSQETAVTLRHERPVLFGAVMMAASYARRDTANAIAQETLEYLSGQMLVYADRSLGLLQGILVLLNWYYSNLIQNPQLTNLCHLAMALVTDLGLNQAALHPLPMFFAKSAAKAVHGFAVNMERRTPDERRAVLGCFYLTSVIATSFTMLTGMPWSAQLQEACDVLERRQDATSGDRRLVALVRLERITLQISQLQREARSGGDVARAPISIYVRPFEDELRALSMSLPEYLSQDPSIRIHHHIAEIHLYSFSTLDTTQAARTPTPRNPSSATAATPATPFSPSFSAPSPSISAPPSTSSGITTGSALGGTGTGTSSGASDVVATQQAQYRLLTAINAFSAAYDAVPPGEYYAQPTSVFVQVGFAIIALGRLRVCNPALLDDAAAAGGAFAITSVSGLMEMFAVAMERVNGAYAARGKPVVDNTMFQRWAAWIRGFKALELILAPPPSQQHPQQQQHQGQRESASVGGQGGEGSSSVSGEAGFATGPAGIGQAGIMEGILEDMQSADVQMDLGSMFDDLSAFMLSGGFMGGFNDDSWNAGPSMNWDAENPET